MPNQGPILVINAGSSSIKFAIFDQALDEKISGIADGIGGTGRLKIGQSTTGASFATHTDALRVILDGLSAQGYAAQSLAAAAHRIVHGGRTMTGPMRATPEVRAHIASCAQLAPLHNPHNLAAIDSLAAIVPDLAQYVSFDTCFHATIPEVAARYAIPQSFDDQGLRRYGFHGLSYASLVDNLPRLSGTPLPQRILALHLGNGASLCAIQDGKSIATTMGYSPLEGVTMGTRSGNIDPNAVLKMVRDHGIDATSRILNHQSGLLALSGGLSDMRALLADPSAKAQFAIEHFCYWIMRNAGGLIAAMSGVDAIVFTGGIGENAAPIRAKIVDQLAWLGIKLDTNANTQNLPVITTTQSQITVWIIPAQEERKIAQDAQMLMQTQP